MVDEIEGVLQRQLPDEDGNALGPRPGRQVRRRAGFTQFPLENLDIRSPERKADGREDLQDALAAGQKRRSTTVTASSTA